MSKFFVNNVPPDWNRGGKRVKSSMRFGSQIFLLFLLVSTSSGQTTVTKTSLSQKQQSQNDVKYSQLDMGLLKSSGLVWIRLYQKMISSQDLPSCNFSPSCSNFGFQSIQQEGLFRGILLSADRLLRCNPFVTSGHYTEGVEKYMDPAEKYTSRE